MRAYERTGVNGPAGGLREFAGINALKHERPYANELIGAQSTGFGTGGCDWICRQPEHWLFAGTGMKTGDGIPGLVGWEWAGDPAPIPGLEILASGPIQLAPGKLTGDTYTSTIYPGPRGNFVFNAATIWWADGLSQPPGYVRPKVYTEPKGPDDACSKSREICWPECSPEQDEETGTGPAIDAAGQLALQATHARPARYGVATRSLKLDLSRSPPLPRCRRRPLACEELFRTIPIVEGLSNARPFSHVAFDLSRRRVGGCCRRWLFRRSDFHLVVPPADHGCVVRVRGRTAPCGEVVGICVPCGIRLHFRCRFPGAAPSRKKNADAA